jgi:hypothetical protein
VKKFALILFALPLVFAVSAKADVADASAHTYTCKLRGNMKGLNVAIGVGGELIRGNGTLACENDDNGKIMKIPVRLSLIGAGAGLEFSIIKSMTVRTAGVKISDPNKFFRTWGIGETTGASLVNAGLEFDLAFRVNGDAGGEGFEVGLAGRDVVGLGAHLYGMGFKIARR